MKIKINEEEVELNRQFANLSFGQRLKYSLKGVGLYFLIALGMVLIPILHFILVPLFLIISLYSGFSRFKMTKTINLTGMTCPNCTVDLKLDAIYFNTEELHLKCDKCNATFTLI